MIHEVIASISAFKIELNFDVGMLLSKTRNAKFPLCPTPMAIN